MKVLKRTQYKDQDWYESFKKDPMQGSDWYGKFYKGPNTRTKTGMKVLRRTQCKDQIGMESFTKDPIQGPNPRILGPNRRRTRLLLDPPMKVFKKFSKYSLGPE
jgi:hypothetical protein